MPSFVLSVNAPNILPYIPAGPAIRDSIKVLDSHFVINSIVEGLFPDPLVTSLSTKEEEGGASTLIGWEWTSNGI